MFKKLLALISTVEILVIPPCFAAERIDASASMKMIPKKPVAVDLPTLLPTVLLVAVTGNVIEQLLKIVAAIANNAIAESLIFFIWFL